MWEKHCFPHSLALWITIIIYSVEFYLFILTPFFVINFFYLVLIWYVYGDLELLIYFSVFFLFWPFFVINFFF